MREFFTLVQYTGPLRLQFNRGKTKKTMKKIYQICFLLCLSLLKTVSSRNQGCGLLILLDDTVVKLFQNNETIIRTRVDRYIEKLNDIYQSTILKHPPNNNIYFFTEHLTVLKSYLPGCLNKGVNHSIYF